MSRFRGLLLPLLRGSAAASKARGLSSAASASSVHLGDDNHVTVRWSDSSGPATFPSVWLRDNCQCPKCFHPVSKGKLFLFSDLDVDIKAQSVELCTATGEVVVTWPDQHRSHFDPTWLRERAFGGQAARRRSERAARSRPVFFGGGDGRAVIRRHRFDEIVSSDGKLLDWLTDLEDVGLTLIKGMEGEGTLSALVDRVGVPKPTHYGTYFKVESKADPSNLAYTCATLGLHLDLGFYSYTPGTQFLHCLSQSGVEGGANEFADAFRVADVIRRNHPEEWEVLTTTPVIYQDVGSEADVAGRFFKLHEVPTIELDSRGQPKKVTFSQQHRDSFLHVPLEQVTPLYKALHLLNRIAYSEDSLVTYKMEEGDCVVFDNVRVMHGRKGFRFAGDDDKEGAAGGGVGGGHRVLHGCYVDWDEIKSRINSLEN